MSERRIGAPRTDQQRRVRHGILRPREKLPPRGTGLRRGTAGGSRNTEILVSLLAPLLLLAFVSLLDIIFSPKERKANNS